MSLGERLKVVRGKISQKEFGEMFGAAPNSVRRYENNEGPPNTDFILSICEHYNINPMWLLTGEGPMREDKATENEAAPEKDEAERQTRGNLPGRCNVSFIEDPIITDLKLWLNEIVSEDPDSLAWFRVELQDKLPKFKAWREKSERPIPLRATI